MKIRGIFCLVLVLLLMGVQGCPKKQDEGALGAYVGGTSGLDVSFVSEEPPSEVWEVDDVFFITLLVENTGEHTIPKGKIIASLVGIDKDRFGMKSLNVKSQAELFGKSKIGTEVVEGGVEELQFDEAEHKYDLPADFDTQMRVDICYDYGTRSLAKLCLKKVPVQRRQEDICSVTNNNVKVENSGAPLQIKDVKSRGSSDSITFTFVIENKGSGDVYEPGAFSDKCFVKLDKKDKVNVIVDAGNLDVKCGVLGDRGSGVVRLVGGMKTVSCSIKTSGLQESAYEEPVEIVLNYYYKEAIGKSLIVLNSEY